MLQAAEGLVDRVHLQLFHPELQQGHQPLAHVGVEAVVGAAHDHAVVFQLGAHLEVGRSHRDAEGAGLGAARDDAAVVVGEHHQRPVEHARIHHRFAGGVEVVAINQHGCTIGGRAIGSCSIGAGVLGGDAPEGVGRFRGHGWREIGRAHV